MQNLNPALYAACMNTNSGDSTRKAILEELQEQKCNHDYTTEKTDAKYLFHLPAKGKDEQYLCEGDAIKLILRALPLYHSQYDFSSYANKQREIDLIYDGFNLIPFNGVFTTKLITTRETIRIVFVVKYNLDGVSGTIYQMKKAEEKPADEDPYRQERTQLLQTIVSICSPFLYVIELTHGKYYKYNPMILFGRLCLYIAEKTHAYEKVELFVKICAVVIPTLLFLGTLFTIDKCTAKPFPFPFHKK